VLILRLTYVCDDGVTIVVSHEVLDSTGSSVLKPVTTDEVVCELVFCCVGGGAVHDGHDAIGLDAVPIAIDFGHRTGNCCSLQTSGSSIVTRSIRAEYCTSEEKVSFCQVFDKIECQKVKCKRNTLRMLGGN
jgi:hypothetical protein